MNRPASRLPAIVEQHQKEVLAEWLSNQMSSGAWRSGRIQESQLRDESQRFFALFTKAVRSGVEFDTRSPQWADIREFLTELSTPVVQLWEGVLALPLIGTLDSEARSRTSPCPRSRDSARS